MKRRISLLLFLMCCWAHNMFGQASTCPPNVDFEYGSLAIWDFYTGTCCPINTPTPGIVTGRHTLTSGTGTDPYGFFPVVPTGGGSYALKLGNASTGSQAEKARYYVHVPSGTINYALIYRYAAILQDAGHDSASQPRFTVNAYDSITGREVTCAQFLYVAGVGLPGFYNSLLDTAVRFKTWTTQTVDLSSMGGRTVILDFATGDCAYGGHFGYAYVDASCGLFAITKVACDSSFAYLTGPGGFANYYWYDSTDFSTIIDSYQVVGMPMPTVATTFALVLAPYNGFGCRDTLYTRVLPSRLAVHKMADTGMCFTGGSTVTLRAGASDIPEASPLRYHWWPTGTLDCDSCEHPVATPTGPTTYYFTVTNTVGCSWTDSIRITGNALGATTSTTSASCYGYTDGTATVTVGAGTPPYRYYWGTSPVQTTTTATNLAGGNYYSVTVFDTTGCSSVMSVYINQPPLNRIDILSATYPTTCGGNDGTITLDSLIPGVTDTIVYYFDSAFRGVFTPRTFIGTASSAGQLTIPGLYAGNYSRFTVATALCPYNITGDTLLVDPPVPAPPATTDQIFCQFATPVPAIAVGSGLLWYGSGLTGSSVVPVPNTSIPHVDTYFVTQTIANCVSNPARVTVNVMPKPHVPRVVDTSFCQYSTSFPLVAQGDSLLWFTTITGGAHIDSTPKPPTDIVGVFTWYVEQTVRGCKSDRAPLNVNILYLPDFTITPSSAAICQADTAILSYTGPGLVDGGYTWTLPVGARIVSDSPNAATITVKFDSTRFQTVILRASDYNGRCFSSDTIKMKVVERPYASFYLKQNICEGDTISVALSSRAGNADHFTWDFSGADIITSNSNTGGPYMVSWSTPGIQIVKLSVYTVDGCKGKSAADTVRVLPRPTAHINYSRREICMEDSVYLSTTDSMDYSNLYEWAPAKFFNNINRPSIWGRIYTPGYVTLTVTNAYGCVNRDSVDFEPGACCTVYFPLAFTPNNDGRNDIFRPVFKGYHKFHTFRITNRWGQTIFETTNSSAEWDGTFGGVPQDMGIYFYYIKFDCGGESVEQKGDVTLIR